ncbi:MAG: hypothetical protein J5J06_11195 [Phycisphaerae bacterium]|nr:hypothetical protein [Phycisphaerae bacterium]
MKRIVWLGAIASPMLLFFAGFVAFAQSAKTESERKVEEMEVPVAAQNAIKALAGGARIGEYAEEIKDGRKLYEGSWRTAFGTVDVLVDAYGNLVEVEESVAPASVPSPVRSTIEKMYGKDAEVQFEKKTVILYEAHLKRADGTHEVVLSPDGRKIEEGVEQAEESAGKNGK